MRVAIKDIVIDDELYPRNQPDWMTVYRYAEAKRTGARFPAIVVGKKGRLLILLDGRHRLLADRQLGRTHVQVIVSRVPPAQFFLEAVRLNAGNGRPLSTQERIQAAERLKGQGFSPAQISKVLFMPIETLRRLTAKRLVSTPKVKGGALLVRKAPVPPAAALDDDSEQHIITGRSALALLEQAAVILEHGWVDLRDDAVHTVVERLAKAIRQCRIKVA